MGAILILDSDADEELVTDDLERLLDELEPVAVALDCVEELAGVRDIVNQGASYERQRAVASRNGGAVETVVAALVEEMRAGRPVLHTS